MTNDNYSNNRICLQGTIVGDVHYSHEIYDEMFFTIYIKCRRMSGTYDILPVTIPEQLLNDLDLSGKRYYKFTGQIRSYNKYDHGKSSLLIRVFSRHVETGKVDDEGLNSVRLDGYICKNPNYRKTPFMREISDLLIAVNRPHKKSDYIPVIAWGYSARIANNLHIGDRILVTGRMQSRIYTKRNETSMYEEHTAYEVSAMRFETQFLRPIL